MSKFFVYANNANAGFPVLGTAYDEVNGEDLYFEDAKRVEGWKALTFDTEDEAAEFVKSLEAVGWWGLLVSK